MAEGGGMRKKDQRPLTRYEVAALWLFHDTYSAKALGAREFWVCLSESNKRVVKEMVEEILKAKA